MTDRIHSILADAVADVEKAGVPDDLREAAFNAAVALRTAGSTGSAAAPAAAAAVAGRGHEDWHGRVASALGVPTADVDEAFDLDDNRLRLTIAPSRLPRQRATAMKDVALLISAARQAAGIDADGWTSVDVIRDECRELGVLDANNFAAEIQLRDVMSQRGRGRSRQLKITRRGYEQAGARLRELLSA
jgi:hypothetical protein